MTQRLVVTSLALAVTVAVGAAQVSNEALRKWAAERNKTAATAASASAPSGEPVDCMKIKSILWDAQEKAVKSPADARPQVYQEALAQANALLTSRPMDARFLIRAVTRDKGIATLFVQGPLPPEAEKRNVLFLGMPVVMQLQESAEQAGLLRRNTTLVIRGKGAVSAMDDKGHVVKLDANASIPMPKEQADGSFRMERRPVSGTAWQSLPNEQWLFRADRFHVVLLKDQSTYQVNDETFKLAPADPASQVIQQ